MAVKDGDVVLTPVEYLVTEEVVLNNTRTNRIGVYSRLILSSLYILNPSRLLSRTGLKISSTEVSNAVNALPDGSCIAFEIMIDDIHGIMTICRGDGKLRIIVNFNLITITKLDEKLNGIVAGVVLVITDDDSVVATISRDFDYNKEHLLYGVFHEIEKPNDVHLH